MSRWLQWLLPEIQLIELIKRQGFGGKARGAAAKLMPIRKIDGIFNQIRAEMPAYILEQDAYCDKLCAAFKRPYLKQPDKGYQNLFAVLGPVGSGRHLGLELMARLMYEHGLFASPRVASIDFLRYADGEETERSLQSELFHAFQDDSALMIISHFDQGCQSAREYIGELAQSGSLIARRTLTYKPPDGSDPIRAEAGDSITANGKYIALISDLSKDAFGALLPKSLSSNLPDALTTERLTRRAYESMAQLALNKLSIQLKQAANLKLQIDPQLAYELAAHVDEELGMHSIALHVETGIHDQLVERCLSGEIKRADAVALTVENHTLFANGKRLADLDAADALGALGQGPQNAQGMEQINQALGQIVGLREVKAFVRSIEQTVRMQRTRRSVAGMKNAHRALHMIFLGNPGTGKTTVARIIAKLLGQMGCLSGGQLVEVSRLDLVGQYQGESAQKAAHCIRSALGGVLFIDEAHTLVRDDRDDYGREAADVLVKAMEDYREDLVVILAGYTVEMHDFLLINPGLKSRCPYTIEFPDYSPEELYEIAVRIAGASDYVISEDCRDGLLEWFRREQRPGRRENGNGRLARNLVEAAIARQSSRLSQCPVHEVTQAALQTLYPEDFFDDEFYGRAPFDLEARLGSIVGMDKVKEHIRSLYAVLKVNMERRKFGIASGDMQSLHMVFMGNPGTGKTMMARLIGEIFFELGLLKSRSFVETDRSGLVAGYVGQTALKTKKVIAEALDGVLFIDEAYSLAQDAGRGYGGEAIDALVKEMDDNRDRLVVILAGYPDEMNRFLDINPGLDSRFPNVMRFDDYTEKELLKITMRMADAQGYQISGDAQQKLMRLFQEAKRQRHFGNGRFARNTLERAIRNQALRLGNQHTLTKALLIRLEAEDIPSDTSRGNQ